MVEAIAERSYLKKLGLVNVNLKDEAFAILTEYVRESTTLTEIDISWSNVGYISMSYFLEVLSENKKLQFVNLSWNQLQEGTIKSQFEEGEFHLQNQNTEYA